MNLKPNQIKTTKYTLVSFIPLNLYHQFTKLNNIFFLATLVMLCIPSVSPFTPFTYLIAFCGILFVSMVKDGIEDLKRNAVDRSINRRKCYKISGRYYKKTSGGFVRDRDRSKHFDAFESQFLKRPQDRAITDFVNKEMKNFASQDKKPQNSFSKTTNTHNRSINGSPEKVNDNGDQTSGQTRFDIPGDSKSAVKPEIDIHGGSSNLQYRFTTEVEPAEPDSNLTKLSNPEFKDELLRNDARTANTDEQNLLKGDISYKEYVEKSLSSLDSFFDEKSLRVEETNVENLDKSDFIIIKDREEVPADCLLLFSISNSYKPGNHCFVETSGLDGETNLKRKSVPLLFDTPTLKRGNPNVADEQINPTGMDQNQQSPTEALLCTFLLTECSEDMKQSILAVIIKLNFVRCLLAINSFLVAISGKELNDITLKLSTTRGNKFYSHPNILLKGSVVKQSTILGLVISVGRETKQSKNQNIKELTNSRFERKINGSLMLCFVFYFLLLTATGILGSLFVTKDPPYLYLSENKGSTSLELVATNYILFSFLVPISLFVTMEISRIFMAIFINKDKKFLNLDSRDQMAPGIYRHVDNVRNNTNQYSKLYLSDYGEIYTSSETGRLTDETSCMYSTVSASYDHNGDVDENIYRVKSISSPLPGINSDKSDPDNKKLRINGIKHVRIAKDGSKQPQIISEREVTGLNSNVTALHPLENLGTPSRGEVNDHYEDQRSVRISQVSIGNKDSETGSDIYSQNQSVISTKQGPLFHPIDENPANPRISAYMNPKTRKCTHSTKHNANIGGSESERSHLALRSSSYIYRHRMSPDSRNIKSSECNSFRSHEGSTYRSARYNDPTSRTESGEDFCICRNSNIVEDLGNVQYVLTDKTGTLTENCMKLVFVEVAHQVCSLRVFKHNIGRVESYIRSRMNSGNNSIVEFFRRFPKLPEKGLTHRKLNLEETYVLFLIGLACCNSVEIYNGRYEGQSQDEVCILEGLDQIIRVIDKSETEIKINVFGCEFTIEIILTLNFTSERRRMSVLVKMANRFFLFTKGSDCVVKDMIRNDIEPSVLEDEYRVYRSLMVAFKEIENPKVSEIDEGESSPRSDIQESSSEIVLDSSQRTPLSPVTRQNSNAALINGQTDRGKKESQKEGPNESLNRQRDIKTGSSNEGTSQKAESGTYNEYGTQELVKTAYLHNRDEGRREGIQYVQEVRVISKILQQYDNADPNKKEQILDQIFNEFEFDMIYLGTTLIEDKIKFGVKECIRDLLRAGIKIWMITGDKKESAISCGLQCGLIHNKGSRVRTVQSSNERSSGSELSRRKKPWEQQKCRRSSANEQNLHGYNGDTRVNSGNRPSLINTSRTCETGYDLESHAPSLRVTEDCWSVASRTDLGGNKIYQTPIDRRNHSNSDAGCTELGTTTQSNQHGSEYQESTRIASVNGEDNSENINISKSMGGGINSDIHFDPNLKFCDTEKSRDNESIASNDDNFFAISAEKAIEMLVHKSEMPDTAIVYRASPEHKAKIARLLDHVVSIGDGNNDIMMLQESDVGIGVRGKEGTQASLCADISVSSFLALRRLILVHGHYNYTRMSKVALNSLYKNLLLILVQFYYNFFNGYSGRPVFNFFFLNYFNVLFTSSIPLYIVIFDKDKDDTELLKDPKLYRGTKRYFSRKLVLFNVLLAIIKSSLLFWMSYFIFHIVDFTDSNGKIGGYAAMNNWFSIIVFLSVIFRQIRMIHFFNVFSVLVILLSIILYFFSVFVIQEFSIETKNSAFHLYGMPVFYFGLLVVFGLIFFLDFVYDVTHSAIIHKK